MIFGIGTDIVRIVRMQRNLDRYGERFAQRILSESEMQEFRASRVPAQFLAKRFAAKEAAAKALGTGFSQGITMRDISVSHAPGGRPLLEFRGAAGIFLKDHHINTTHLSVADEEDHAVAFVTLVRD